MKDSGRSIDREAAASFVKRVTQLKGGWPENGLVCHPRIIRDLSTCGIVIMEWIDATVIANEVRSFPFSNNHLIDLTRMAAMWLQNFHSAQGKPDTRTSGIAYPRLCSEIVSLAPSLLNAPKHAQLKTILSEKHQCENFTEIEQFLVKVHNDFGIHNVLTRGEFCYGVDFTWDIANYSLVDAAFYLNSLQRKLIFRGWIHSDNLMDKITRNFIDVYDCGKNRKFHYFLSVFQLYEVMSFFQRHKCHHTNPLKSRLFEILIRLQANYLHTRVSKLADSTLTP
ncbi:MAG: hypothetical protein KDC18_03825 [Alphaproteobacteria bacterium]|nr:hypothetical protein [Alphaproteobacteria bacterium]MCB9929357.1 hypothetical protein [Alphaproteobacteria bacterium]